MDILGDRNQCTVCRYVYDPKTGDPTADILQGTGYLELPDDWVCPECAAGKVQFVKEEPDLELHV
jgi:rubredoxin